MSVTVARPLLYVATTIICAFLVLPTLAVVPVSFTATDYIVFPPQGFTLHWYAVFVGEGPWRDATLTSLALATVSSALATLCGTLAALGLRRLPPYMARVIVWIFLLPLIVPSIIIAVALYGSFARLGIVGTFAGLVLAHAVMALPFVVITVSAVLQKLDLRIIDAARSLGASPVTAFWKVTLPAIMPGVAAGAVFAFLTSFDEVVVALFISGITIRTLPVQMWNGIRFEVSPAVAAASTIVLIVAIAILSLTALARRPAREAVAEAADA